MTLNFICWLTLLAYWEDDITNSVGHIFIESNQHRLVLYNVRIVYSHGFDLVEKSDVGKTSSVDQYPLGRAISNDRGSNFIPIVLEMDDGQYTSWVELFKIHCRAHDVIHHIIPAEATPSEPAADKGKDKADDAALQKRLDSIVLQWIYGTISKDLLITILKPNSTAAQAWKALENIFIDSKPSRALYLENKFNNIRPESFSNVPAYCQELKTLSTGLETDMKASPLCFNNPPLYQISTLPDPTSSWRKLARIRISTDTAAALNTQTTTATTDRRHQPLPTDQQYRIGGGRGQYDYSNRGWNNDRGGQGRGRGRGRRRAQSYQPNYFPPQPSIGWNASWQPQLWNFPPAPYPTTPVSRPQNRNPNFAGILGTNPYVNAAPGHSYTPTNIEHAMHTMTLNPDQNWYLDSGATNHMSNTTGNISNYFNNGIQNNIVVGEGSQIPIHGTGHTTLQPPYPHNLNEKLNCDNGTEYNNKSFHDLCSHHGMVFRFSCPHTSSQNGKAERKIRSINNIVRTLLTHASLPPTFWHHALQMATYILNIIPSKTKNNTTPTLLLYNKHPSYTHLRTFGCLCYPLIPSTSIHKLENRSTPCVFLGYRSNHRGYKCYDLSTRKIIISLIFTPPSENLPTHTPSTTTLKTYTRRNKPAEPKHTAQTETQQLPLAPTQPTTPSTSSVPNPLPPPTHPMCTRSMIGSLKPKQQLNLHTSAPFEPLPRSPTEA
ncbi:LOW QUALITY PROTEIN: hypothetical protein OSB04_028216 [Centaurea solstitialis]|uniref:Integrase catalytic domain-containing protein n=1 Tax=Centaurea solstitialis TaxID=347529 RepID=A0AA38SFA6_9ASTR|nr:LOW QUALITY PROTEIN: hypothetical protein OSB04_028216 [Centaurea solstitialis]